jgi:hypothetical protein
MRKKTMAGLGLAAAAAAGALALGGVAFAGGDDPGSAPAARVADQQWKVDSSTSDGLQWAPQQGSGTDSAARSTQDGRKDCPEREGSGSTTPEGDSGSSAPEAPATTPSDTL